MAIYCSPWRYWTHGDDICAAARDTVGIYKLSLHASGRWGLAFNRARVNNPFNDDGGRRAMGAASRVAPGLDACL